MTTGQLEECAQPKGGHQRGPGPQQHGPDHHSGSSGPQLFGPGYQQSGPALQEHGLGHQQSGPGLQERGPGRTEENISPTEKARHVEQTENSKMYSTDEEPILNTDIEDAEILYKTSSNQPEASSGHPRGAGSGHQEDGDRDENQGGRKKENYLYLPERVSQDYHENEDSGRQEGGDPGRMDGESTGRQEGESTGRQEGESTGRQEGESTNRQEGEGSVRQGGGDSGHQNETSPGHQEGGDFGRQERVLEDKQEAYNVPPEDRLQNGNLASTEMAEEHLEVRNHGNHWGEKPNQILAGLKLDLGQEEAIEDGVEKKNGSTEEPTTTAENTTNETYDITHEAGVLTTEAEKLLEATRSPEHTPHLSSSTKSFWSCHHIATVVILVKANKCYHL